VTLPAGKPATSLLHCNSGFNCCNCHFRRYVIDLSGCPRNGLSVPRNGLLVPRNQTAPRNATPVPRNRSDVPRNAKIVPGNILAPRNDPAVPGNAGTVPRNAENQNEQVSFSFLFPWSLECKKRDPAESDLPIRQTSGRMRVHNAPPHNTISILPSERHVGLWDMVPSQSLLNQSLLHLSLLHSALLCGLWCEGIGIVRARLRHGGH